MNCYAVNEADNGLVHRDYSQVYDPRLALTSRFFHSGFGGGGEGSRSPKGASILAITLVWGARRNRSVVRPRLSPVKHSNVSIKLFSLPLSSSPHPAKWRDPFKRLSIHCLHWQTIVRVQSTQMLKKLEMTRKRYPIFKFFVATEQFQFFFFIFFYLSIYIYITNIFQNRIFQSCYYFSLSHREGIILVIL